MPRCEPVEQPLPNGVPAGHPRVRPGQLLRPVPRGAAASSSRWSRSLSRLPQPAGPDRRPVPPRPFAGRRRPAVPHRRPGPLPRRRRPALPRPAGLPGQGARASGSSSARSKTTLQQHPDVRDAVVALHGDRLVGYVVARRPEGIDLDDIRAYLRRHLAGDHGSGQPEVCEELPHTPNGKVDRLALPAPDDPTGTGSEPPRGHDEELVAEVWRQVLEIDSVSRDDDSSTWAATRCSPARCSAGCAGGPARRCRCGWCSRIRASPTWPPRCPSRRPTSRSTAPPCRPGRPTPHRSSPSTRSGCGWRAGFAPAPRTTCTVGPGCAVRWTWRRWSAASGRSSRATRCSGRPSRWRAAGSCSACTHPTRHGGSGGPTPTGRRRPSASPTSRRRRRSTSTRVPCSASCSSA